MPVRATKRGLERTPLSGSRDVLICGASFAGLAVARELRGSGARVLILDRYEVGERQTSACAAPTEWLVQPRAERVDPPDVRRRSLIHTPARDFRWRAALHVLDVRLPEPVRAAARPGRRGVRDGEGRRAHRVHRPHRPRRPHGAADRRRARLAAGAVARRARDPAAGGAAVARAGGPPVRHRRRPRAVARPRLRARGLLVELPGRRRAARRRRLVRAARPRQGADRAPRGRPVGPGRALPGQLDPAPDAPPDRGRRLLRRRLGRPLPADDGRGHPHGALLRPRVRARAARRRRGPPGPRAGARPLRGVLRPPSPAVPLAAARAEPRRRA